MDSFENSWEIELLNCWKINLLWTKMFQRAKINGKGQGKAYKMYDHVRMLSAQNESGEVWRKWIS